MLQLMGSTPGVIHHGRQSREKMRELNGDALIHLYPCVRGTNLEIDCILVKESALAGILPVIPHEFVFPERAGYYFNTGNQIGTKEYFENAANTALKICDDVEKNGKYQNLQLQICKQL